LITFVADSLRIRTVGRVRSRQRPALAGAGA
jgi:hypothetical protein